jgi:hypothetical protein
MSPLILRVAISASLTTAYGAAGAPGCPRRRGDPAVAGYVGLCRREQTARPFIQTAADRRKSFANR